MRFALVAIAALLAGCSGPKELPVLGQVPQFQLTAESGEAFDSTSLNGQIWVANFIFTQCTGPCPMMTRQMRQIQAQSNTVRLVSFSVDPANDTPPALAAYARNFKPDFTRWRFLTGEQQALNDLALKTFKLNGVDGSMNHSTRFVLVDRKRQIRAYYISTDDGVLTQVMHDIRQLEREPS